MQSAALASARFAMLFGTGSMYSKSSGPYLSLLQTAIMMEMRGHRVSVLGTANRNEKGGLDEWKCSEALAFRKWGPTSMYFAPGTAAWLGASGRSFDLASIEGVWQHNFAQIASWCRAKELPYVISPHGSFSPVALRVSSWKKSLAMRTFARRLVDGATCFHALTEVEYREIRRFGLKQPVCIVPNGIELPERNTAKSSTELIPAHFLQKRTLLYLGRLHPIKGIDRLIKAWEAAGAPRQSWQLIIAGGEGFSGYLSELKSLARECGLEQDVHFIGAVYGEQKSAWFRFADAYVLPSHSEGFPMTPLEAMSFGTPVLLTDTCNFPEAEKAGAAIVVPSSEEGVADGVIRMLSLSEADRLRMGEQARDLVAGQYGWDSICARLEELYAWMKGAGPAPRAMRFD